MTIPPGDIFFHTGDFTHGGSRGEVLDFLRWLHALPHSRKIIVAGNHDRWIAENEVEFMMLLEVNVFYLRDTFVDFLYPEGPLRLYGSPWIPASPRFAGMAFVLEGWQIREKWAAIDPTTNVLLVHSPVYGILDRAFTRGKPTARVGCPDLRDALFGLPTVTLVAHGHIHDSYGSAFEDGVQFLNSSAVDKLLNPRKRPRVIGWNGPADFSLIE